jgi:hypothetical protein
LGEASAKREATGAALRKNNLILRVTLKELSKSLLIFITMLRNFNVGCVTPQANAPWIVDGALAYGITVRLIDISSYTLNFSRPLTYSQAFHPFFCLIR